MDITEYAVNKMIKGHAVQLCFAATSKFNTNCSIIHNQANSTVMDVNAVF